MSEFIRKQEVTDDAGEFQVWEGDEMLAHMTYARPFPDRMIVQHTQVAHGQNGRGLGKMLFGQMIAFARQEKISVVPTCQFTRKMFDKFPEYKELL